MKAAVVSVGNELIRGRIVDTNAAWLSQQLLSAGYEPTWHLTTGDDLAAIEELLRLALEKVQLVIVTGGLGPTRDDLTRDALARLANRPLVEHRPTLERIERRFRALGRPMPERNRVQALIPEGAEVIPNDHGTAPGLWLTVGSPAKHVVALPGVPAEMKAMFVEQVLPRLRQRLPTERVVVERCLHVFGIPESEVEARLGDLTARGRDPEVGITVHEATITLRVVTGGRTAEEARNRMEPTVRTLYERLGELIFGEGDETLASVVGRELKRLRLRLAVAEGASGGALTRSLCQEPGASEWFLGAIVPYSNELKTGFLGVPEELVRQHGAASREVAEWLATSVREHFRADIGLAIVGYFEPPLGGRGDLAATVWVASASQEAVRAECYRSRGSRPGLQERAAKAALNHLRLRLRTARPWASS